jgi:hypothetical protein
MNLSLFLVELLIAVLFISLNGVLLFFGLFNDQFLVLFLFCFQRYLNLIRSVDETFLILFLEFCLVQILLWVWLIILFLFFIIYCNSVLCRLFFLLLDLNNFLVKIVMIYLFILSGLYWMRSLYNNLLLLFLLYNRLDYFAFMAFIFFFSLLLNKFIIF